MTQERVTTIIVLFLSCWLFFITYSYASDNLTADSGKLKSAQYALNKRIYFSLSTDDLCFGKIHSVNIANDSFAFNRILRYKQGQKFDLSSLNEALKKQGLTINAMEVLPVIEKPSSSALGIGDVKKSREYFVSDDINKDISINKYFLTSVLTSKKIIITLNNEQQLDNKIMSDFKNTKFYYHKNLKHTSYKDKAEHIMMIPFPCNRQLIINHADFSEPSDEFRLVQKQKFDDNIHLTAYARIIKAKAKPIKRKRPEKKSPPKVSRKAESTTVIVKEEVPLQATFQEIEFVFSERPFLQTSLRPKFLEQGTKITHVSSGKEIIVTDDKKLMFELPLNEKVDVKITMNNPDYSIIESNITSDPYKTVINTIVRDKNDEILIIYYPLDPTTTYRSRIADDIAKLMNFEFSTFLAKFKDQYSKVYFRMREEGKLNEFTEKFILAQELLMSNDELRDNEEFNWSDTSIYNEIKQMNESSQVFHIIYFTGKNEPDLIRIFQKAPNARVYAIQFENIKKSIEDKDVNESLHLHKINYHNLSSDVFNDVFNSENIIKYFREQK